GAHSLCLLQSEGDTLCLTQNASRKSSDHEASNLNPFRQHQCSGYDRSNCALRGPCSGQWTATRCYDLSTCLRSDEDTLKGFQILPFLMWPRYPPAQPLLQVLAHAGAQKEEHILSLPRLGLSSEAFTRKVSSSGCAVEVKDQQQLTPDAFPLIRF
ncbi:hypothetical protein STEG23_021320, partial [Scotinomys teguina]